MRRGHRQLSRFPQRRRVPLMRCTASVTRSTSSRRCGGRCPAARGADLAGGTRSHGVAAALRQQAESASASSMAAGSNISRAGTGGPDSTGAPQRKAGCSRCRQRRGTPRSASQEIAVFMWRMAQPDRAGLVYAPQTSGVGADTGNDLLALVRTDRARTRSRRGGSRLEVRAPPRRSSVPSAGS